MASRNFSGYFASFTTYGKTSDVSVQKLLSALGNSKPQNRLADVKELLTNLEPLNKEETEKNYPELLKKSMLVNNKIANTAIPLTEQKIINTSNYEIIELDDSLKGVNVGSLHTFGDFFNGNEPLYETTSTSNDILEPIKGNLTSLEGFTPLYNFDLNDVFKNIRKVDKSEITVGVASKWAKNLRKQSLESLQLNNLDDVESAESWLKVVKDDNRQYGANFRFNFTVYREGTSVEMKPIYGNALGRDPYSMSQVSLNFVNALQKTKREKNIGFPYASKSSDRKIDFNVKTELSSKVNRAFSGTSENWNKDWHNPFVRDMLLAGPDLYSNMFDVYLRFNSSPTSKNIDDDGSKYISNPTHYMYFMPVISADASRKFKSLASNVYVNTFKDVYSLSVRTASVDIPFVNCGTTELPFLNTKVQRPNGIVDYDLQGSLIIDCDANTYVNDMFISLAGLQRDGYYRTGDKPDTPIKSSIFDHVTHFPFMAPAKLGYQMSSVDIVVSSHGLGTYKDELNNPGGGGFLSNILYVFKDVRFLGGGDIKFSTDSAESQTVEAGFIARRLETYYRPDNTPLLYSNPGIIRDDNFDRRIRTGTIYDESSISEGDW